MNGDRWDHIKGLYVAASARPVSARAAFLLDACQGDDDLRREVQVLLDQPVSTGGFLAFIGSAAPALEANSSRDLTGARLGVFELRALIGRGGMGDVYRAYDTKLGRDVAIKVLPSAFTADPSRLAAFEREARVLASLNHPHIAAIHGVEESGGVRGLVLELVEGETLAERLPAGLRLQQILACARQIADALEAAHEKGIIHRDLKPANVKITPDDVVKLLDFGIAKVVTGDGPGVDLTHGPATTLGATRAGLIAGTAGYMSPEHATGKPVDKRTDIWAFGCVLYEMLARRRAFAGDTLSGTIAAILDRDPDWSRLPPETPRAVRRLIQRCLEKDPKQRLRDIGDARLELEQVIRGGIGEADEGTLQRVKSWRGPTRVAAAGALVTTLTVLLALSLSDSPSPEPTRSIHFTIPRPENVGSWPRISPDGRFVVFGAAHDGRPRLWLRALDDVAARPLEHTHALETPFWGPDGQHLAFFADGKLKTIAVSGGLPQPLGDALFPRGGTWNRDGTILFVPAPEAGIQRVSANGGPITRVTVPEREGEGIRHLWPQFLPDGRRFLYLSVGAGFEQSGLFLGSLDSGRARRLMPAFSRTTYAAGHLLFVRYGQLVAQRFDVDRESLVGDPVLVAQQVSYHFGGDAAFDVADGGVLVYQPYNTAPRNRLLWIDRDGTSLGPVGPPGHYRAAPRLSPDGRQVAVERFDSGNQSTDIWVFDVEGQGGRPLTSDQAFDGLPAWSPDGSQLAFSSNRLGNYNVYVKEVSGVTAEKLIADLPGNDLVQDWSPDGRLVFIRTATGAGDMWALRLTDPAQAQPLLTTQHHETDAELSPDARWVAYSSTDSGSPEVYVRPFHVTGTRHRLSTQGGAEPHWRGDGRELFYIDPNRTLMAVPVDFRTGFTAGSPRALFSVPLPGAVGEAHYAVTRDGRRFLVNTQIADGHPLPLTVIVNWRTILAQ